MFVMEENKVITEEPKFEIDEAAFSAAGADLNFEDSISDTRLKRIKAKLFPREYSYLIYAFLIPIILNYIIYLAMEIHPFGDGSVLVLDLNGQYVYFYEALRNAVFGEESFLYSFSRSLGGEFGGIYAYYVASPLSYIVCLFPQERILEALLFIFLLKTGLCGLSFGYYLHKISSNVKKIPVITFSILYALCSYAVVQQHNSMWIDALIWLPLLTLGIEQLIKNYKYKLLVVSLAMSLLSNFYIGYMVCIYTALYFFYYYFAHNENKRNNPRLEKSHFRRSLFRMAGAAIIGIGISAVIVLSAYYALQFGKNTFSKPNFSLLFRFDLFDFFTKFFPGSYDTVRPIGMPFVYCGILTLFCVPIYFFAKKFTTREKIASAILISVFTLSFAVNTLDMIWHGFQKPNWLNYRYSFMLCFILLVLAYKGFGEIRRASTKLIAGIGAILIGFIAVAQKFEFSSYVERESSGIVEGQYLKELETVWFSFLAIIAIGVVLCIATKTKRRTNVSLVLCILVCLEVFANGLVCCVELGDDVIYSSYSSYNDYIGAFRPLADDILENDPSFYRFEKTSLRKTGDNMALRIRGLTNSTSTLNKSTIDFLNRMGYTAVSHWTQYQGGNPVSDSLLGLKYIIGKTTDESLTSYYDSTELDTINYDGVNYSAYLNPYALSIAYGVDDAVLDYEMSPGSSATSSSPMKRLNELLAVMSGEESVSVFKPVEITGTSETNCTGPSAIAGHSKYTPTDPTQSAYITYSFTAQISGEAFFYMPSDYNRRISIKANGKSYGTNENSRIISIGFYSAGDEVTVDVKLENDVLYVKNNTDIIYMLDKDAFKGAIAKLQGTQLKVGEDWSNDYLPGTITTKKNDQRILTTIPYDEGWKITVDGEEVEITETLDALISFNITKAGDHEIVMQYRPTCVKLGLIISISSIIVFALVIIFDKKIRRALSALAQTNDKIAAGVFKYGGDCYNDDFYSLDSENINESDATESDQEAKKIDTDHLNDDPSTENQNNGDVN
jgi:uncharacterized membrane protein YfhO